MRTPSSNSNPGSSDLNYAGASVLQSGLLIALLSALFISGWSLFVVGRHFGLPVPVAVLLSAGFDGAALAAAGYSIRYVMEGIRSWFPRLVVLVEVGASMFLNAQHALIDHDPVAIIVLYSTPPLTVVLLLEMHLFRLAWHHRRANSGLNPEPARLNLRTEPNPRTVSSRGRGRSVSAGSDLKEVESGAGSRGGSRGGAKARRSSARAEGSAGPSDKLVRAWAKGEGLELKPTGPVPGDVRQRFLAAQNGGSHEDR